MDCVSSSCSPIFRVAIAGCVPPELEVRRGIDGFDVVVVAGNEVFVVKSLSLSDISSVVTDEDNFCEPTECNVSKGDLLELVLATTISLLFVRALCFIVLVALEPIPPRLLRR